MTDQELIIKYLAGDIQAFNTIVHRWETPIFNFVLQMCGDYETSKDISQKVFIRVYKNLKTLKEHKKFKNWLYQIAANLCRDEIRRRSRRQTLSVESIQEAYEDGAMLPENLQSAPGNSPEQHWSHQEMRQIIEDALQKIPEEQRVVIVMKEFQGLKFIEIAEILEQSVNTIKSRMYYGLNALRKLFDQWNIRKEAFEYDV